MACIIGGRSKAFMEAEFEVIFAIDNDRKCATVYSKVPENKDFIYRDLKDISPKELPYADIMNSIAFFINFCLIFGEAIVIRIIRP